MRMLGADIGRRSMVQNPVKVVENNEKKDWIEV